MNSPFFEKSKEIANNYIQSVVFLDDKAYQTGDGQNPDHDFDALQISKVFASENKICAVYRPESEEDIENFKIIANKADIVILDWQINLANQNEVADPEADAEVEDPRGQYTKAIIKAILEQIDKGVKLILIYTGDYTLLEQITTEVYEEIFDQEAYTLDKADFSITSDHFKVLVRAKNFEIKQKEIKSKYEGKILQYPEIPGFVISEFASITSGLLSNFALMALTAIRKNSSKLLALYSKKLDPAYFGHKSLLPYQNDAEDLLMEMFGSTLVDLLKYKNIGRKINDELISDYLDDRKDIDVGSFVRTSAFLKELIASDITDERQRFSDIISSNFVTQQHPISKAAREGYLKKSTILFKEKQEDNHEAIDNDFAVLTHHKNVFLPADVAPKLSLGTLVKSSINHEKYYLCIQQRCDSVRISEDEKRRFLFLPLDVATGKFNFITTDGIKLHYAKKSYNLRTLKFASNDNGAIHALPVDDKYLFRQMYDDDGDEQFIWIMDLKDLHAQRIVSDYAASLSRVGLDESEWLRRSLLA
ncbi:response regulator receiver domain [Pedobacter sp. MR22-3]|uniref:response regulator receiver domain n=1 Tax=Pedobacter sp. MR22-3 TaxID=2994552 RepID=UPI00224621C2|nr:response regulator receiver domain [Pedobacter sp. MR22-3]MCX2582730.1 response regulator receiver domain [Pedobacter sp. MR22-3]